MMNDYGNVPVVDTLKSQPNIKDICIEENVLFCHDFFRDDGGVGGAFAPTKNYRGPNVRNIISKMEVVLSSGDDLDCLHVYPLYNGNGKDTTYSGGGDIGIIVKGGRSIPSNSPGEHEIDLSSGIPLEFGVAEPEFSALYVRYGREILDEEKSKIKKYIDKYNLPILVLRDGEFKQVASIDDIDSTNSTPSLSNKDILDMECSFDKTEKNKLRHKYALFEKYTNFVSNSAESILRNHNLGHIRSGRQFYDILNIYVSEDWDTGEKKTQFNGGVNTYQGTSRILPDGSSQNFITWVRNDIQGEHKVIKREGFILESDFDQGIFKYFINVYFDSYHLYRKINDENTEISSIEDFIHVIVQEISKCISGNDEIEKRGSPNWSDEIYNIKEMLFFLLGFLDRQSQVQHKSNNINVDEIHSSVQELCPGIIEEFQAIKSTFDSKWRLKGEHIVKN